MPKLNVPPTKSSYLTLSRQLESAEEGYDLLEQKRQILIYELMSRLGRARDAERRVGDAMGRAFAALRGATLDIGSEALDRATLGVRYDHAVELSEQSVVGLRIPATAVRPEAPGVQFGVGGTSAGADLTMRRFVEVLPLLGELAELENAVLRLARELRKTQRRCNALSKVFIPTYTDTIDYIQSSLEERERESLIIMKMVRDRLTAAVEGGPGHG